MIFLGLGSNLPGPRHAAPREVCEAAVALLDKERLMLRRHSSWYASAPVPPSDQPWFVNGLVAVETEQTPEEVLDRLHAVEAALGRQRSGTRNEARVLDLDIIDFDGLIRPAPARPELPHPRLAGRAFVLMPLAEIAPAWRHPVTGQTIAELIEALPPDSQCRRLDG